MIGIKHVANLTYKVLTASLGLVSQESHKIESDKDIYQRAYEHLRRAKDDGRNKVISSMI
jgi:GGDEF domain-containing protein